MRTDFYLFWARIVGKFDTHILNTPCPYAFLYAIWLWGTTAKGCSVHDDYVVNRNPSSPRTCINKAQLYRAWDIKMVAARCHLMRSFTSLRPWSLRHTGAETEALFPRARERGSRKMTEEMNRKLNRVRDKSYGNITGITVTLDTKGEARLRRLVGIRSRA